MIRLANERDFDREIKSESELRICALVRAYGLNVPFIRFFADDEGALTSIMDGICTFYCASLPNDEWSAFLQMHSGIKIIRTDAKTASYLAGEWHVSFVSGSVMRYDNVSSKRPLQESEDNGASLREIYGLLSAVFDSFPSFEGWYVDASHRVRHGCCHIAAEKDDGRLSSVAMTVAETEDMALIGGVATLPDDRGRGAASRCIRRLIGLLTQSNILIAPSDEYSARLYSKLGFVPWGTWAELILP